MRFLLAILFMSGVAFAQTENWRPFPSQYYDYASDTGVVIYADMQTIGKYETAYRFGIYLAAMSDSARIFIPADNIDEGWIECRMLPDTLIDSTYVNIAYGSCTQITTRDRVFPISVMKDSSYYWDGALLRSCLIMGCPGFPAPYLVLMVDGSSRFPSDQHPYLEIWVYIRRRI